MSRAVLYFTPDVTDAKFFDRVRSFQACGCDVMSVGFSRARYDTGQRIEWPHLDLGRVGDGYLLARGKALSPLISGLSRIRRFLSAATIRPTLVARNLDMALWARSVLPFLPQSHFVYESLDIHHSLMSQSYVARVGRLLERRVLARADMLWTSSPSFVEHYFCGHQHYDGPWCLIENKLSMPAPRSTAPTPPFSPDGPLRIGWFGTLRCARSLEIICALAATLGDRVFFDLRGHPARIGEEAFTAAIAPYPNIQLGGAYSPQDLPKLMSGVHLSWGFDYSDTWGNSQWLRPNRLYEAGYYHRPILADAAHEAGRLVLERNIGWALNGDRLKENLLELLDNMTLDLWRDKIHQISIRDECEFRGFDDINRALDILELRL